MACFLKIICSSVSSIAFERFGCLPSMAMDFHFWHILQPCTLDRRNTSNIWVKEGTPGFHKHFVAQCSTRVLAVRFIGRHHCVFWFARFKSILAAVNRIGTCKRVWLHNSRCVAPQCPEHHNRMQPWLFVPKFRARNVSCPIC